MLADVHTPLTEEQEAEARLVTRLCTKDFTDDGNVVWECNEPVVIDLSVYHQPYLHCLKHGAVDWADTKPELLK